MTDIGDYPYWNKKAYHLTILCRTRSKFYHVRMKVPEYTNQNPLEQQILPEVRLNVELIQFTALSCF